MEAFVLILSSILIGYFIFLFTSFFIGSVLLHFATIILKFEKRSIITAFVVVIIGIIISLILRIIPFIGQILGLIAYWYFIKSFYDVGWGKAILAWLISILVTYVIAIVIIILLGFSIGITFSFI